MGFSIYNIFKASLLVGNAAAILHPKKVLSQYKLTQADLVDHQDNPLMVQAIGLLQAVSYLKLPLIVCNILVIVVEVIAG
jgi:hypothetical protein